jgi:uncharacterized membrane protein
MAPMPLGAGGIVLDPVHGWMSPVSLAMVPLPNPQQLMAYEEICPGIANRIVTMAENAHTRAENRLDRGMELEYADRRLGMLLGFGALFTLVCSGTIVIALGNTRVGASLLGVAALGTVIGAFINGRNASISLAASMTPERPNVFKRIFGWIQNLVGV